MNLSTFIFANLPPLLSRLFIDIIESLPYHEILPRTSNINLVIFLRKSSKIPQDFVALDLIRER